tara:strand:+ start:9683 stop:9916 length:234 start_codon:yes stop_codon:yes gene_type:complete
MLKWFIQCFGCNNLDNEDENEKIIREESRRNLRYKLCEVCYRNRPLYYRIPSNEATHCRDCKEEGMKIFLAKNSMKR